MENGGYGDENMENGFHALQNGVQPMENGFSGSHALEVGITVRAPNDRCAVCQYEGKDCHLLNCIFHPSFHGSIEGRDDFARCLALYGGNLASQLSALPRNQQHVTMESLKLWAWRIFERRRRQAYDGILINLRRRFPWARADPEEIPQEVQGFRLLPCMVCVSHRADCPQDCIFAPFFPHGRQGKVDYASCREKYGGDVAYFFSDVPPSRRRETFMIFILCARPLGDGSCYADDESFMAELCSRYLSGGGGDHQDQEIAVTGAQADQEASPGADSLSAPAVLDGSDKGKGKEADRRSPLTDLKFLFFVLVSFTAICGVAKRH